MLKNRLIESTQKSANTAIYKGKMVTIITVFKDINIAMIEDENGEIFDVEASLIRVENS